jgi:hypothetical protein
MNVARQSGLQEKAKSNEWISKNPQKNESNKKAEESERKKIT